ncbi:rhodanese-like domain-containing protein [Ectopseudomonas mendocina]|uniref:Rhodanese-like domain-containing protein n=1 Tax=Ectopseudomonas mendocina TaxID=300 RepID=A0ABZ2RT52_ECTME
MDAKYPSMDELKRPASLREVLTMERQELFTRAYERTRLFRVSYAGLLYPPEAWLLSEEGALLLVDVRTHEELSMIGRVPGALHIAWQTGVQMVHNPRFIEELDILAGRETAVGLFCRSGKRSSAAAEAAAEAGFTRVFNVIEGFEGCRDAEHQQSQYGGWRHWRLPWLQD